MNITQSTLARLAPGGFKLFTLTNHAIEVTVAPALGSKVVSLKNLRTGREWMYFPTPDRNLFANKLGDDFARGTVAGWDECLPTIAPSFWAGRQLPDHGEVWSMPWELDLDALSDGLLQTSIRLPISPLRFTRAIKLDGNSVIAKYRLTNLDKAPQKYLWSMHPLLALQEGDALELPDSISRQLRSETWLKDLSFGSNAPACAKVYAGPLIEGRASVKNGQTGDVLSFAWDANQCNMLGIWLTRGGWNGLHHLALEPTNGGADSLADAAARHVGTLAAAETKEWQVRLSITP